MDYTAAQVRLYLQAGERLQRERVRQALFVARAAQADKAGYENAWKLLED